MTFGPTYFNGTPPELDLGHVYLELNPSGKILRAWTRTLTDVDPAVMPALQMWVDSEIGTQHPD